MNLDKADSTEQQGLTGSERAYRDRIIRRENRERTEVLVSFMPFGFQSTKHQPSHQPCQV